MMKVSLKHMVEIAGGLVIGSLAGEAINKIVYRVKEAVVMVKKKGA